MVIQAQMQNTRHIGETITSSLKKCSMLPELELGLYVVDYIDSKPISLPDGLYRNLGSPRPSGDVTSSAETGRRALTLKRVSGELFQQNKVMPLPL